MPAQHMGIPAECNVAATCGSKLPPLPHEEQDHDAHGDGHQHEQPDADRQGDVDAGRTRGLGIQEGEIRLDIPCARAVESAK